MAPVSAEEAAAMAMPAPAATPTDAAMPTAIFMIFIEKTHISVFRCCVRLYLLTYRKI
jgi:hypothetical protein